MTHIRLNAKVISDSSGRQIEIPVILIQKAGRLAPLEPLVDYLLKHSRARSLTWMRKLCQIVGMLLDYLEANPHNFEKPLALFENFTERVYSGSIGQDGSDPSGLYWLPRRARSAKQLLQLLSEFSDELHRENGANQLNPWREATSCEQRLNWAAYINRSERSFLGHLDSDTHASETAKQVRSFRLRRTPSGAPAETKAFPENKLQELLFDGFLNPGKANSSDTVEKYDWRGICITLLMNQGGLRECECFHLWVHDVVADPVNPGLALVRVFHPIDGAAPKDFSLPNGRYLPNREAYLGMRYPGYGPRNKALGSYHAGWKEPKLTDESQCFIQVHWLPPSAGQLFMRAWKFYMLQRMRAGITANEHPFLFVSFRDEQRGMPYTIASFREAHARAVTRIGLVSGKYNGTTEHGHRHAYGQRGSRYKLDEQVLQAGMHHRSIESQGVYTEPSIAMVTEAMKAVDERIEGGITAPFIPNFEPFANTEISNKVHQRYKRR